jgi:putative nucleotidyltransferase with HDIG domain
MTFKGIFDDEIKLRDTLLQVGVAMARAQELRDPYTTGHSIRVSRISKKIAEQLGWADDRILGLELAGLLHDIGKIGIPSDILMKPTDLTRLEEDLVKEHVQKGYDVLKDLPFPFPLAEIVYQHHERLDGSGYPCGLKGDKIIPEARIIAVSDVMEALTTSRPYRPELSLYDVIDILRDDAGVTLDKEIIDVAIGLIKSYGDKFWR